MTLVIPGLQLRLQFSGTFTTKLLPDEFEWVVNEQVQRCPSGSDRVQRSATDDRKRHHPFREKLLVRNVASIQKRELE